MEEKIYRSYIEILKEELVPALGCTEPIAIAYAAAKAVEVLKESNGEKVQIAEHKTEEKAGTADRNGAKSASQTALDNCNGHLDVYCSGNIIKNVKSVTVPNSGGMRGIEAAALLGLVGGDASRKLEVLESITEEQREETRRLLEKKFCTCYLQEGVANLYIRAELTLEDHSACVTIEDKHTNIIKIEKDGVVLFEKACKAESDAGAKEQSDKRALLNVADILRFADEVRIEDIKDVIGRQIEMNTAISEEGLRNPYGAEVGRTLLYAYGDDIKIRAKAKAAAGSDARMNGCSMPVVINSGSGNQGMTCSLPVIEYAKELKVSKDKLYRALVVSNLVAIHQKSYIGSLSAYCGAVSAACGAGAAIAWLNGGDYEAVARTITNALANTSGMVCDGAKSSCAAKIASAVDAAIMAYTLESANHCFQPGEGLVKDNVEDTIRNMGYVGRVGMKDTDVTILNLMIDQQQA